MSGIRCAMSRSGVGTWPNIRSPILKNVRVITPSMAPSILGRPTCDLRQEKHLAVGTDRLQEGVLVDLAVNGHRHALLEVALDAGMQLGELLEELLHGRRREVELGDAPRELREVADQHHARHACDSDLRE